eukprot:401875-Pyramimonas_sp.AAC.1
MQPLEGLNLTEGSQHVGRRFGTLVRTARYSHPQSEEPCPPGEPPGKAKPKAAPNVANATVELGDNREEPAHRTILTLFRCLPDFEDIEVAVPRG